MSSMVLARKYRPQSFEAMVGQSHVVQALSNALNQQRLHHAYLFTGTRGVGKTTVSRILAKSLNCVGPDGSGGITARPCGQCQPCRDIDAGRFVDYIELDAASNRGVDEISQLLDQSVYKPVVGRFKVYMIDEVHMLSTHAFNAMLKTLEEPPDYLKFVLATTDPQKVPVTVLSRCLQFNLRPMGVQTAHDYLAQVLLQEGIESDAGALRLLASAGRGSMRDALSLTDQAIAFGSGAVKEDTVRQMLGAVDRQHVQHIIEAVAQGDGAGLVAAVDTLRELGLSAAGTLEELATALQRMAVLQAVPSAFDVSDPEAALWQALAPQLAPDETQLFYSLALQGRAELALAPDEYSGLLMILLRLLAFKPGQNEGAPPRPKAEGSVGRSRPSEPAPATLTAAPTVAPPATPPKASSQPRPTLQSAAQPVARPLAATPATARGASVPHAAPAAAQAMAPRPATPVRDPGAQAEAEAELAPERPEPPADAYADEPMESSVPPWEEWPENASAPAGAPESRSNLPRPRPEPVSVETRPSIAAPVTSAGPEGAASAADTHAAAQRERPPLPEWPADPWCDRWADVVAQLTAGNSITALVREMAMQAQCLGCDGQSGEQVWRLRVDRESLRGDLHRDRLAQALTELLGQSARIEFQTDGIPASNTPAQRDQVARERRLRAAEDLITSDPMVRELLQAHPGARIVAGSIRPL